MSDWGSGLATGMAVGLAIGLLTGRKHKPWSELTQREKNVRIGLMTTMGVLVIAGITVLPMIIQALTLARTTLIHLDTWFLLPTDANPHGEVVIWLDMDRHEGGNYENKRISNNKIVLK